MPLEKCRAPGANYPVMCSRNLAPVPNRVNPMSISKAALPLLLVGLAGCDFHRTATTQTEPSGTPSANPTRPAGDPQAAFIAAFRQACARKDVDQMLQLYCWDGVDSELRETIRGNVTDEFRQPLTDVKIEPPPPGKYGPTVEGGIRWKPNLPVVAVLKVRFAPPGPGSGLGLTAAEYGLGLKNGQYRLVVNVRER
ncbi:MAG: hypothetical protein ACJ8F7_03815 [Gemmataceae bacterium]